MRIFSLKCILLCSAILYAQKNKQKAVIIGEERKAAFKRSSRAQKSVKSSPYSCNMSHKELLKKILL